MDYNDYSASLIIKQRHAELIDAARREALAQRQRGRRPVRTALGTALIQAGAWLIGEREVPRRSAQPG
jgi:hypothetical protein